MRIEIPNFDKVESGFEPLTPGRYTVLISAADVREKKGGSAEDKYINWELTVIGPTDAGRKLWLMTSLKTDALWNLKALLKASNAKIDDKGFATEDVIGLKMDVNVEQEDFGGRLRNRVSPPYYPPSLR